MHIGASALMKRASAGGLLKCHLAREGYNMLTCFSGISAKDRVLLRSYTKTTGLDRQRFNLLIIADLKFLKKSQTLSIRSIIYPSCYE